MIIFKVKLPLSTEQPKGTTTPIKSRTWDAHLDVPLDGLLIGSTFKILFFQKGNSKGQKGNCQRYRGGQDFFAAGGIA